MSDGCEARSTARRLLISGVRETFEVAGPSSCRMTVRRERDVANRPAAWHIHASHSAHQDVFVTPPTIPPGRWERLQEIFHAALALSGADRAVYLSEACGGDSELSAGVRSLLAAHLRSGPIGWAQVDGVDAVSRALAGSYRIDREIGTGGMAVVYLAHDIKHERRVAVKVLRSNLASAIGAQRFLQEIRLTANLQHPHILPLYDSGKAEGEDERGKPHAFLYYVMSYVAGGSLRQTLARQGRIPLHRTVDWMLRIGRALDFAHGHGVVHRDIKPENILLQDGEPLVADFGIARATTPSDPGRLTEIGMPIGTPSYMSPEQASGVREIDGRTDVYAVACVVYECLTGRPPYVGDTVLSIMHQHITAAIPSVAALADDVPERVDHALTRALAKEPRDRFATVSEFAAALAGTLSPRADSPDGGWALPSPVSLPERVIHSSKPRLVSDQQIRFCRTSDGTTIAYATVGEGSPLVKASNWLSHLEFDWESPMWRHWWEGLAGRHRFIRYDERGCGLSDWDADEMSFEAWVSDLEAVVEAEGLERFALLGVSQGGPIAIAFAVRHPEKVSHLILHGAFVRGRLHRNPTEAQAKDRELQIELVRQGWGQENPAFRQVFSMLFYPGASGAQLHWFSELMRVSSNAYNAERIMRVVDGIDVRMLAPKLQVPTLVLHCKGDARVPFAEGRLAASLIPGARFVPLESKNHIPLEDEPAWRQFLDNVYEFLGAEGGSGDE